MGSAESCKKPCYSFVDDEKMNSVLGRLVYVHIGILAITFITIVIGASLTDQLMAQMDTDAKNLNAIDSQITISSQLSQACLAGAYFVNDSAKLPVTIAVIYDNSRKMESGQTSILNAAKSDSKLYAQIDQSTPFYNSMVEDANSMTMLLPILPPNVTALQEISFDIITAQYSYSLALTTGSNSLLSDIDSYRSLLIVLIAVSLPLVFVVLICELIFVFRPTIKIVINSLSQFSQINSRHAQAEQQLAQISQNLTDAVLQKWQTIVQYRSIFEEVVLKAEINYQTYVKLGFYFPHAKKAHEELASILHKRTAQLEGMRTQLESSEKYAEPAGQCKAILEEHLSKRIAGLKPAGISIESIMKSWQKEKRVYKEKNSIKLQGIQSNILTFIIKNNLMEKILLRFSLFEVERGESLRFVLNRDLEEKNAMGLDGVDRVVLFGKRFHGLVKREHSTENWDFYRAVEEFKRARLQIPQLGQAIYKRFLVRGAPDPINLDSGTKGKIEKSVTAMIAGTKPWSQNVYDGAQSVIVELMASDSYKRFLRQAECAELYHELRREEMKAKEALLPLFKFAERLKSFVLRFCMECVKSGHYEEAQDLWGEGMKLFEKVGPVCIPEADALLASCQHEYTRIQESVARQDLSAADKRASKLLSMMERLKKEWIKEFLTTAREQQSSVLPLLRVDAIHRLEKQLKAIERSLRDLKLRGDLVSVTRSSHEDSLDDSKVAKESKTNSGDNGDRKQHWYAQSIIQKDDPEDEEKLRPALGRARSETGDADEDDEGSRTGSTHDLAKDAGKRDSPLKHARSIDIRDLYEETKTYDGSPIQKEKSKNKKSKDGLDKSLVSEYFKKLTKTKVEEDDETASATISTPKQKIQSKKGTMKKAELKITPTTTTSTTTTGTKPAITTTKDNNKTYTRIPSPEPSDLGEINHDDSMRSISVVDDPSRVGETDSTTPRSVNSVASDAIPSPIKIMAIPEEGRHSDDENATSSNEELTFTPNPLSDGLLLDSRPLK